MRRALVALALALVGLTPGRAAAQPAAKPQYGDAIKRGVDYLVRAQAANGEWSAHGIGSTAVVGLALLECGVAPEDPVIVKALAVVRAKAVEEGRTYQLSAAIQFLDRYDQATGTPVHRGMIQMMALRLMAGQRTGGGWSYPCIGRLPKAEADRLRADMPPNGLAELDLPRERDILAGLVGRGGPAAPLGGFEDNSNTQFAVLALWVARRNGLDTMADNTLARVAGRFRRDVVRTGPDSAGWGYFGPDDGDKSPTPSMTCAGLIGLAVDAGVQRHTVRLRGGLPGGPPGGGGPAAPRPGGRAPPGPAAPPVPHDDPVVRAAMNFLAQAVEANKFNGEELRADLYFLWSLERVGVVYDIPVIAGRKWHDWGGEYLLATQKGDGHWDSGGGHSIDAQVGTALALLFLRQANIAQDLTREIALHGAEPSAGPAAPGAARPPAGPGAAPARPAKPATAEDQQAQIERLASALVAADADRQAELIEQYKTTPGVVYSEALAQALPKLSSDAERRAREALVDRLSRMAAETLRAKLADENPETRRAAALACGRKGDRGLVPDLITAVGDDAPAVARSAGQALGELTGRDFGPSASSTASERARAQRDWRDWWVKHPR
jgi:hypothetical protein